MPVNGRDGPYRRGMEEASSPQGCSQGPMGTQLGLWLLVAPYRAILLGAEFWEGDATKQKSVKRSAFSLNGVQAFSE